MIFDIAPSSPSLHSCHNSRLDHLLTVWSQKYFVAGFSVFWLDPIKIQTDVVTSLLKTLPSIVYGVLSQLINMEAWFFVDPDSSCAHFRPQTLPLRSCTIHPTCNAPNTQRSFPAPCWWQALIHSLVQLKSHPLWDLFI